ncbi:ankyrin repeat-containing protein BDA1-like [Eucalyptus grandis]|uniref:ankyrin repeat-containing protein BDA1-like n=1 Tax=Eucalyptus grandis TaxID=71139 RepID=UPI00192EDDB5|nr:ankyrin repeat-containing protein BDA1-like [Eucalyptus grandis]
MDTRLQQAIDHDDVDELYRLIEQDQDLLDQGSRGPFPNTPLHYAVDEGKTKVAMEIAILNSSFAQKLNRRGYSPMHLALQKKHYDIVRALITLNPELIRENVELLDLLAEFLSACKSSIEDLTSQCETAVHIAVKNYNIKAFKVLFGWLKRTYMTEILDWKDQDGNNVLHIAASQNQPEV